MLPRLLGTLVTTGLLLSAAACVDDSPGTIEDGADDVILADGKADGQTLTEAEVFAVLRIANAGDATSLGHDFGLTARVAKGIVAYRAGVDGKLGTKDDQAYESLDELDAVPYVGPKTFRSLLDHAHGADQVDLQMLGRHDVSVLFPLPAAGKDLLWPASAAAKGGALLPAEVFAKVGQSLVRELPDDQEYAALRVVGLRVDPCFKTSLTAACQPQVRAIFQTLGTTGTNDGAIHALYNLDDADFAAVVAGLHRLVALAPENRADAPLGVSPALKKQGLDGAYGKALRELILAHAGAGNLARMTFISRTDSKEGTWNLGGFHVQARAATGFPAPGPIKIVGSTKTVQNISNASFGAMFTYDMTPEFADAAGRSGASSFNFPTMSAADRGKVLTWARTQQNPTLIVPDTADCGSCHLAGHVRAGLEAADAKLITLDGAPRILGGSEKISDNLRTFGYFDRDPQVTARAANETAAVVRALAVAK
jgi:hypothetical protein